MPHIDGQTETNIHATVIAINQLLATLNADHRIKLDVREGDRSKPYPIRQRLYEFSYIHIGGLYDGWITSIQLAPPHQAQAQAALYLQGMHDGLEQATQ